ncbi:MAG TPA: YrzI family small protein [Pseudoneobacillus sp.]|nr:YrzI family small protein [Pseudoneobacillus sp.]
MTLNILFLTITIKKRLMSQEEYSHYQMVKKIEEENRYRQANIYRMF